MIESFSLTVTYRGTTVQIDNTLSGYTMNHLFANRPTSAIYIAEIGLNHNGSLDTALHMIDAAADAGAHAVKFQTFVPELMNSPYTKSILETGADDAAEYSIIDFFKKLTLTRSELEQAQKQAIAQGLTFFSAPFDGTSLDMLVEMNIPLIKVASSEITNIPLLRKIAAARKPVLLSTGMASENEVVHAVNELQTGNSPVTLLHCVSLYPTDNSRANLLRISRLRELTGLEVGLSDHSTGTRTAEAAAVLGCRIFEKHFTLSSEFECPDRAVSLDPAGFQQMIRNIEETITMLGTGICQSDADEMAVARAARRSLFFSRDITAGETLCGQDLIALRPGTGISPAEIDRCTGKTLLTDVQKGSLLRPEHVHTT